jgi:outer membrane receptor protein involved in Fe transport
LATITSPASGETAKASANDATLSELIVTANKREERIQDVPLSISAVAGAELVRNQVQDIQDLARSVPGISFIRSGSIAGNGNQIILRGLNTGSGGATVATAVDDAPLSFSVGGASFASDFEPWDLQRVEVLRGPQGSLYGATAEGGLIKYVTNAPDVARFAGGFDVGAFDLAHGSRGGSAKGYLNVPLAQDVAALRVSGYYHDSPGWIDNELGGDKNINHFERYGVRASLLVKPTAALTLRGTALYQVLDSGGFDAVEVNGLSNPSRPFAPIKGYNLDTFQPQPSKTEASLYIVNVNYDFGAAGLQSITSYGKMDNLRTNDVPLYGQVFGGLLFGRPNTTLVYELNANISKVSQEFRLYSQNDAASAGGLQWQVGAFYTREKIDNLGNYYTRDQVTGANVGTPFGANNPQVLQANERRIYREYAAYADATYFFSHNFDIELGGRVFNNKQRSDGLQGGAFLGVPLGRVVPRTRSGETSFTFAVSPRYHFNPDVMAYARVASGYRPGGPQSFIPNAPPGLPNEFDSDKTINYEAGLKGTILNRRLSFDVAAFYVDWRNVQITVSFPSGGVAYNVTGNAGHAVSKGFEWTFNLTPAAGLTLTALGAYTDATLTRDAPGIGGFDGDRLPYVPKLSGTLSANYEWDLGGDLTANVGASYSHSSGQFSSYTLTPSLSHLRFRGYDTLSAQIGVRRGPLEVLIYGKNLTDEAGITYYYAGQSALGGTIPAQTGLIRPREIGVRVSGTF